MFSCGIWDLVLRPGIKPGPPALGAWSLSKWTTGRVTESKVLNSWSGTFWLNSSVSKGKLSCAQKPLPPKARTTQCVHFFDTSFLQGGFCMDAFWLFESHQCAHKIVHICAQGRVMKAKTLEQNFISLHPSRSCIPKRLPLLFLLHIQLRPSRESRWHLSNLSSRILTHIKRPEIFWGSWESGGGLRTPAMKRRGDVQGYWELWDQKRGSGKETGVRFQEQPLLREDA